jgi:hypothetical protein
VTVAAMLQCDSAAHARDVGAQGVEQPFRRADFLQRRVGSICQPHEWRDNHLQTGLADVMASLTLGLSPSLIPKKTFQAVAVAIARDSCAESRGRTWTLPSAGSVKMTSVHGSAHRGWQ